MSGRSLDEIRKDIDSVDHQLVDLLDRRTGLAKEVGAIKGRGGRPFFTPEREKLIFEKLESTQTKNLRPRHLKAIYREIISAARDAEKPLSIAYWGPPGSFSELAALDVFGHSSNCMPVGSIAEVFQSVEQFKADYGVVPIENSTAGIVPETLDMFPVTNVKICAETFLAIHHHLATQAESLDQIKRVFAGPQPSAQCRNWLKNNLPNAEIVDVTPTSKAAALALQDPEAAAIANQAGADRVGLNILVPHIEDHSQNRTRFVVIGANEPAKTGSDKTSLLFNLRNRPGELYEVLGSFVRHSVNLLMIESRPAARAAFEYIFYVDCAGHQTDENVAAAISEIRDRALETVVLGSYPSYDPNLNG